MFTKTIVAAFAAMLFISSAAAEERLGVAVYPGAKYDQARTKLLQNSLSVQGAAYLTGDDIARVMAFYRKQGLLLLKTGGPSNERARFKNVDTGVDVVVESSRKDSQSNAKMAGTVILIFTKDVKRSKTDSSI